MRLVALVAALVVVAGSFQIGRPGYSVDEEFTAFAVRGIHAHGVPLLPSGLLYDRGLAYSYASAIVDGRIVMRDRKILTVDEPRIIADANRVGQRVWSEVQKAGPIKVPRLPRPR